VIGGSLLVAACTGAGTSSVPEPSSSSLGVETSAPIPTATLALPAVIDLATTKAAAFHATPNPDFAVVAGGFLYAGGVGDGIAKIDEAGARAATFSIPTCAALDVGFDAVWSAACDAAFGLARIETATDKVTKIEIGGEIPDSEASIGVGEGGVWMMRLSEPRELIKIDPATNTVVAHYPIDGAAAAVRAGLGAVWVSDPSISVIHRVDPATGAIVADIKVGRQPQFLAVGAGAVWTMDQLDGTVSRIDPLTNAVAATIKLGEPVHGGDIAVGGGYVWLRGSSTLLFQIDPATNTIVKRYGPSADSGSVAADDDAVWITAHEIQTIWRLPLR
jgi:virginiamycin B lyase